MYLHFPLHLFQVAFGIAMTDTISIHAMGWDDPVNGGLLWAKDCGSESTSSEGHVSESTNTSGVTEHAANFVITALSAASSEEESAFCEITDPSFVIKVFWIAGGLILCVNTMIKLVNTPVKGGKV
jgi:hypothetical protein